MALKFNQYISVPIVYMQKIVNTETSELIKITPLKIFAFVWN